MDVEDSRPQGQKKQNNVLPLWGNEKTMNLNSMILTNVLSSPYFKNELFQLKTYHEVVDEIYYKVDHLEPWEKGSRKTAGQVGMCGGVRGVGAGGIVSTSFCLLYKLFTLKLTRKQLNGLITHADSPYIRALGFMFIRYCQPPAKLWEWMEPYLEDEESIMIEKETKTRLLTTGVLESLQSTSDASNVVARLQDNLQLTQAALTDPGPETTRLIRCLATIAKNENRLDVVQRLRQISPAGTTGPLLSEHLDVREIPPSQIRELTITLSGGGEWKLVAERLGLNPAEIRYLDNRL
ncbi:PRP38 pre-mRNA processing factor 38 domain-containing protein B [Desmophyllum pertusum]|uniref:Pre-mRNA-splicing factor 38 n=1 Tax=Desmophyllum pertusum TaxID=174260 RepID=A0A9W9Z8B4_9CNID|nr:PRP38 pre-mRNA processing factor 38 domain-containing protein B [Desmophyllum pertusum]